MALQRYDTRLASEEDYLPQIRSDWASIVDPFEKQREAEALLGAGYTPESLIGQFNRQFGGGATLDDLNFLLSYGKPSETAGALSTVGTGYYGDPDTSVQGPLSQLQTTNTSNAIQTSIADQGPVNTQQIADALNLPASDVSALMGGTSTVMDTGAASDAKDVASTSATETTKTITDFQGNTYDLNLISTLADQVLASTDVNKLSGGVYGTKGQSVGFDYNEVVNAFGRDVNPLEQTALDIARNLASAGITDLSQIKATETQIEQAPTTTTDEAYVPTYLQGFSVGTDKSSLGSGVAENDRVLVKVGETYTGEGATDYYLSIDPTTGKQEFVTKGRNTSDLGKIQTLVSIASFIPGLQPFAMALNGAISASQGDVIGALANLTGAGGAYTGAASLTDVSNVLRAADAADKGNVVGAFSSLANTSFGSGIANADLGVGNLKVADLTTAANAVSQIEAGNWGGALTSIGKLTNSADAQMAGAAVNLVNAIQDGNPLAIANAAGVLNQITQVASTINVPSAAGALQTASAGSTMASDATAKDKSVDVSPGLSSLISGQWDAGVAAYTNAINAGATPEEAKIVADFVSNKGASTTSAANVMGDGALGAGLTIDKTVSSGDLSNLTGGDNKGGTEVTDMTLKYGDGDDVQEITHTFNKTLYGVPGDPGYTGGTVDQYAIGEGLPFSEAKISQTNDGKTTLIQVGDTNVSLPTWGAQLIGITSESVGDLGGAFVGAAELAGLPEDSALSRTFKKMETLGQDLLGKEIKEGRKDIVNRIDKAEGWEKIPALWEGIKANPGAAVSYVGKELPQEFLMLGAAAKVSKFMGFLAGLTTDAGLNAAEAGGAAYREAKAAALAAGKSEQEARDIGMDAAMFSAGMSAVVSPVLDFPVLKVASGAGSGAATKGATDVVTKGAKDLATDAASTTVTTGAKTAGTAGAGSTLADTVTDLGKGIGRTTASDVKETLGEAIEEGTEAGAISYLTTGNIDWNNILTNATIGGAIGGKTATTIETSVNAVGPEGSTANAVFESAPDQSDAVMNTVSSITAQGGTPADVSANLSTALSDLGLNASQIQTITNSAIAESAVNQINSGGVFTIGDVGTIVGTDSAGNNVTLADVIADASVGAGNKFDVDSNVVIGTNADGSSMTIGDLTAASQGGTIVNSSSSGGVSTETSVNNMTGAQTTTSVDSNTGVTTAVTLNPATNTQSSTSVDSNNNTTTATQSTADTNSQATVNGDTNTATATQTNVATGTTTDTTIDANNNITTTVETNANTGTTTNTTVDANANTQTSVSTDGNVTTEVTVDPNANTATNTTTDTNTNTQTAVTVNTNTNTATTVTTNIATNTVIDEKTVPLEDVPITTLTTLLNPTSTPTKTTTPKKSSAVTQMPLALGAALAANPSLASEFENLFSGPSKKFKSPLDDFMQQVDENYAQQVAEQEAAEAAQRAQEEQMRKYYSYGREREIDDILGEDLLGKSPLSESFEGLGMSDMYPKAAKAGGLMTPLMAKGGNPPAVHYAGKPRIDFRKGAHVAGPGDGQSDDIPAMLADGEFVFPADVVAALGNGSTKAGSDKLYEMMHEIRRSYRSAKPKDLPPPAKKSPLEYLSKKGRR